jgi:Lipocalin-like domain
MKIKNLLLIAFVAVMAVACGPKEPKDIIQKTWTLDAIDTTEMEKKLPPEQIEMFKKMFGEVMSKLKGKATQDFKAEGKYQSYTMGPDNEWKTVDGTWALSADNKTLTLTSDNKPEVYTIKEITNEKLWLEAQGLVMKFVPKE